MAIPANTTGKVQYTGDGTTKTFPLTFPIFKTTAGVYAIRVSVADSSGESVTVLVENTDYTVNESGNSFCDVVLNTAPAAGKIITIIYNNELSQLYAPTDFTNLPAQSLINAFDKLTAICIQMSEELNRCVKESVESPVDPQVVVEKVNALYTHLAALTALASDLTKIDAVYADLAKVVIDANNISDINTVALDIAKINALAAITTAISSCYSNMSAILDAPNQAAAAQKWATDNALVASTDYSAKKYAIGSLDVGSAKDWAIKEGGQVGTTGKYSAKVYSLAAENHYEKARDWASKTNGQVESTDYSSKAYAISEGLIPDGSAKEWATSTSIISGGKYGARYYALQADNANTSAQNAKTDAKNWATKTDAPVSGSDYSAKYYALQVATYATEIVALYAIKADISTLAAIDDDVSTVATISADVSTVAAGMNDVVYCSANMAAILAAPDKADDAAASAAAAAQSLADAEAIARFEEVFGGTFGDDTDAEIFGGNL